MAFGEIYAPERQEPIKTMDRGPDLRPGPRGSLLHMRLCHPGVLVDIVPAVPRGQTGTGKRVAKPTSWPHMRWGGGRIEMSRWGCVSLPLQVFEMCWGVAVLFDPPQIDNDAGLAQGRATAPYLIACFNGPLGRTLVWKCHQSKFELVADVPSLSIRSHKRQHCKKKMETKQPTRRKNRYPRCYTLYSPQRCRLPWRIDYSSGESDDLSRSNRTTRGGTLPGTGCAVTNGASGPTTDEGSSARHNWARPGQCISPYRVLAPRQRREFTWPMLYPSSGHLGLQDLGVACQKYMCNL